MVATRRNAPCPVERGPEQQRGQRQHDQDEEAGGALDQHAGRDRRHPADAAGEDEAHDVAAEAGRHEVVEEDPDPVEPDQAR
jgi:hypothetical protein